MEVIIKGIAPGGMGYTEVKGRRVYVAGVLPGDRVEIGKPRQERGRSRADLVKLLERKHETREAPCELFGQCGGCDWMDVPYGEQVLLKEEMVREAFAGAKLPAEIESIVPSPEEFRYRNRVDFAFGNGETGPVLGLYERGNPRVRTHELPPVCAVSDCWLANKQTNTLRSQVASCLEDSRLRSYNPVTRAGVLRSLEVRSGEGGKAVIQLSVANEKHVPVEALKDLLESSEDVGGFAIRVSRSRSRHAPPKREQIVLGETRITQTILDCPITFSASVFSQVNAFQLDRLYGLAIDMAQLTAEDEVLDLYCGVGALSIPIAKVVSQLTGVELDEGAVQDATVNATSNKVDNCNFVAADAANVSSWGTPLQRFDLVTVNPPRAGLDPGVIEGIAATRAKRIVYVSCNPETLVRDCKRLTAHHYAVSRVCPVDMFPQTTHVETVVCLERQTKPVGPGVG